MAEAARVFEQLGATIEEKDPGLGNLTDSFVVLYQGAIAGGLGSISMNGRTRWTPTSCNSFTGAQSTRLLITYRHDWSVLRSTTASAISLKTTTCCSHPRLR
ncbi:MAG: hypothetical protein CM1200mP20_02090 [Pseudomonadota bacterium]|nr:MAG: hypothetical protein CM1200mP20_02090 [Pseudomonadota bacterium]